MPKTLKEIFKVKDEEELRDIDPSVLLDGVIKHIRELDRKEFTKALQYLPFQAQFLAMKERCNKAKDEIACSSLRVAIEGDPSAPAGSPRNLGLRGLWEQERNEFAKDVLKMLGEL